MQWKLPMLPIIKGQIQVKDKLALKWPGYNADMASDFMFCQNLIKLKEDQI